MSNVSDRQIQTEQERGVPVTTLVGKTLKVEMIHDEDAEPNSHRVIHVSGGRLITIADDGEICALDASDPELGIKLDPQTERSVADLRTEIANHAEHVTSAVKMTKDDLTRRLALALGGVGLSEDPLVDQFSDLMVMVSGLGLRAEPAAYTALQAQLATALKRIAMLEEQAAKNRIVIMDGRPQDGFTLSGKCYHQQTDVEAEEVVCLDGHWHDMNGFRFRFRGTVTDRTQWFNRPWVPGDRPSNVVSGVLSSNGFSWSAPSKDDGKPTVEIPMADEHVLREVFRNAVTADWINNSRSGGGVYFVPVDTSKAGKSAVTMPSAPTEPVDLKLTEPEPLTLAPEPRDIRAILRDHIKADIARINDAVTRAAAALASPTMEVWQRDHLVELMSGLVALRARVQAGEGLASKLVSDVDRAIVTVDRWIAP